LTYSE